MCCITKSRLSFKSSNESNSLFGSTSNYPAYKSEFPIAKHLWRNRTKCFIEENSIKKIALLLFPSHRFVPTIPNVGCEKYKRAILCLSHIYVNMTPNQTVS